MKQPKIKQRKHLHSSAKAPQLLSTSPRPQPKSSHEQTAHAWSPSSSNIKLTFPALAAAAAAILKRDSEDGELAAVSYLATATQGESYGKPENISHHMDWDSSLSPLRKETLEIMLVSRLPMIITSLAATNNNSIRDSLKQELVDAKLDMQRLHTIIEWGECVLLGLEGLLVASKSHAFNYLHSEDQCTAITLSDSLTNTLKDERPLYKFEYHPSMR
ncbi:uncharacterized protein MELLADRAFT_101089 [Melampsora larici-populina 98AG31]|uniref:Uncharacterized protein n=1 Tax=Melampsora larici-populina (strain 98AG31 / pathotype 3-4-7) TaxID=747676 RepID=F4R3K7_MELLP|nr:uncharacterized protein MELLADRAFT_101089 [Melampsora larici-populina 98AG31]EGG13150.1 hypothetical protein MELLADRAFT_101089 [Melampsora larici-populina 98AG31]